MVRASVLPSLHFARVLVASLAMACGLAVGASTASADRMRQRGAEKVVSTAPRQRGEVVRTHFQFPVGSIVIVNNERRLYYISAAGEAVRYRVAVGKSEELWMGRTFIAAKVVDPRWIPVNGDDPVEGGNPANPLGKRALYLDWSLLRIHGTPSRGSIGSAVSNGCIRMLNEDVIDLFDRVHFGAPVYAIPSWSEASLYEREKVGEKIYANPAGHEQAKQELEDRLRERSGDLRDRDASIRRGKSNNPRFADATTVRVNGTSRSRLAASRSDSWDD